MHKLKKKSRKPVLDTHLKDIEVNWINGKAFHILGEDAST